MAHLLRKAGFEVHRQKYLPVYFDGLVFDEGLRMDLLVNDLVIVALKAVHEVNPVWVAQIISHLKLTDLSLGYLINFNVPIIKQGIRRFRN